MKKSKKIIIGFIIFIGLVFIQLLSYKFALVQFNKPTSGEGSKTINNVGKTIKINKKDNISNKKSYLGMNYPQLDGKFEFDKGKSTTRYSSYYLYDETEMKNFLANVKIGTAYNYYDDLAINSEGNFSKANKKLLDKYNINNNFDLIDYARKHYNDKVNIFTDSNEIKMHSLINNYINKMPNGEIRDIEGDYEGFIIIFDNELTIDVNLKHGDDIYYLSFINSESGKFYNLEKVTEFISSITFND